MKTSCTIAIVVVAAVLSAAFFWTPAAAHAQNLQMTWVDRSGKPIETVGPGGAYRGPDLAPDGKRFAVHRHPETNDPNRPGGGDVWIFDSGPGPGRRLTGDGSEAVENGMPIWSPDGARIVFGSVRKGKGGLYMKRADGSGTEELLIESETSKMPMSWSPDGQYIVYWVPGNIQWILPLKGDRKPFQLSAAPTSHAQISPDGKWIAYMNMAARSEIVVKPFPTGSGEVQVSKDGGVFARWRGDGKELYFLSQGSQGQMMAADITVTGSKIQAGAPHALFDSGYVNLFHPGGNYHVFSVSRDGQRFLIPRPDATPGADDPNARLLTLVDRQGKTVGTVEERGFYTQLSLSADQTRVTLMRNDPVKGTNDVWVFDLATGKGIPITSSKREDAIRTPVWSPDGKQIAYVASRSGTEAIYRKPSNGEGAEELVYKLTGAGITLQQWTSDGRYLTFYSPQLGGNIEFALPLDGDPQPIQVARSEYVILAARLSPDHRFVAFRSNESGKDQIWVRRFDPSGPSADKWQVSTDGGTGPVSWRADGKELYYLSLDRGIMAVDVRTESGFEFGAPRLLFKVPEAFPAGAGLGPFTSMGRDGERFLFAVPRTPPPTPPLPQITILDRQGKPVQRVGESGRYSDPALSPDGSRVLVRKSPETVGNTEIWSFDVATGKGLLIASSQNVFPNMLWSPDGKQVFYVVNRPGGFNVIMRKAADGSGSEEMLYRYTPGAPVNINDITPDGKFLTFDSGGVILIVPLTGGDASTRQATEVAREEYFTFGGRFSPDGRLIAYLSTETDRTELYVRPFNPASGKPVGETKWQLTKDGVSSIVSWRADGRELYYRKGDMTEALTMSVDVTTAPSFQPGTPKFLFRGPNAGGAKNISRDGQRSVVVMPPAK
jgi:Tol biopolymer transport system component